MPALPPIAISLQAGFMEECVFRAIPLALGALIGERYGRRRLGIAIAFVLQALVFGGAHANYPGLPSYSRLVELVVPSMLWALIFLRYGLLPTILLHAVFDLALFSIPVFLVDAPGALRPAGADRRGGSRPAGDRAVAARCEAGAWGELPDALRNGAWQPRNAGRAACRTAGRRAAAPRSAARRAAFQRALPLRRRRRRWSRGSRSRRCALDAPPLADRSRRPPSPSADAALAARGVTLGPEWRRFSVVRVRHRRRPAMALAQVRLARGRPRRLSRAGRQHARAAGMGGALRDVRRRRRASAPRNGA